MELDATLWTLVALILFIGLIVYLGVPGMLIDALDSRAAKIRSHLDEARRAREEAKKLLADLKTKTKETEVESERIISTAKREADAMIADAERRISEYVERRTAMADEKISQAEANAMSEVRSVVIDRAIEIARSAIKERMDDKLSSEVFDRGLEEVKARLKQ